MRRLLLASALLAIVLAVDLGVISESELTAPVACNDQRCHFVAHSTFELDVGASVTQIQSHPTAPKRARGISNATLHFALSPLGKSLEGHSFFQLDVIADGSEDESSDLTRFPAFFVQTTGRGVSNVMVSRHDSIQAKRIKQWLASSVTPRLASSASSTNLAKKGRVSYRFNGNDASGSFKATHEIVPFADGHVEIKESAGYAAGQNVMDRRAKNDDAVMRARDAVITLDKNRGFKSVVESVRVAAHLSENAEYDGEKEGRSQSARLEAVAFALESKIERLSGDVEDKEEDRAKIAELAQKVAGQALPQFERTVDGLLDGSISSLLGAELSDSPSSSSARLYKLSGPLSHSSAVNARRNGKFEVETVKKMIASGDVSVMAALDVVSNEETAMQTVELVWVAYRSAVTSWEKTRLETTVIPPVLAALAMIDSEKVQLELVRVLRDRSLPANVRSTAASALVPVTADARLSLLVFNQVKEFALSTLPVDNAASDEALLLLGSLIAAHNPASPANVKLLSTIRQIGESSSARARAAIFALINAGSVDNARLLAEKLASVSYEAVKGDHQIAALAYAHLNAESASSPVSGQRQACAINNKWLLERELDSAISVESCQEDGFESDNVRSSATLSASVFEGTRATHEEALLQLASVASVAQSTSAWTLRGGKYVRVPLTVATPTPAKDDESAPPCPGSFPLGEVSSAHRLSKAALASATIGSDSVHAAFLRESLLLWHAPIVQVDVAVAGSVDITTLSQISDGCHSPRGLVKASQLRGISAHNADIRMRVEAAVSLGRASRIAVEVNSPALSGSLSSYVTSTSDGTECGETDLATLTTPTDAAGSTEILMVREGRRAVKVASGAATSAAGEGISLLHTCERKSATASNLVSAVKNLAKNVAVAAEPTPRSQHVVHSVPRKGKAPIALHLNGEAIDHTEYSLPLAPPTPKKIKTTAVVAPSIEQEIVSDVEEVADFADFDQDFHSETQEVAQPAKEEWETYAQEMDDAEDSAPVADLETEAAAAAAPPVANVEEWQTYAAEMESSLDALNQDDELSVEDLEESGDEDDDDETDDVIVHEGQRTRDSNTELDRDAQEAQRSSARTVESEENESLADNEKQVVKEGSRVRSTTRNSGRRGQAKINGGDHSDVKQDRRDEAHVKKMVKRTDNTVRRNSEAVGSTLDGMLKQSDEQRTRNQERRKDSRFESEEKGINSQMRRKEERGDFRSDQNADNRAEKKVLGLLKRDDQKERDTEEMADTKATQQRQMNEQEESKEFASASKELMSDDGYAKRAMARFQKREKAAEDESKERKMLNSEVKTVERQEKKTKTEKKEINSLKSEEKQYAKKTNRAIRHEKSSLRKVGKHERNPNFASKIDHTIRHDAREGENAHKERSLKRTIKNDVSSDKRRMRRETRSEKRSAKKGSQSRMSKLAEKIDETSTKGREAVDNSARTEGTKQDNAVRKDANMLPADQVGPMDQAVKDAAKKEEGAESAEVAQGEKQQAADASAMASAGAKESEIQSGEASAAESAGDAAAAAAEGGASQAAEEVSSAESAAEGAETADAQAGEGGGESGGEGGGEGGGGGEESSGDESSSSSSSEDAEEKAQDEMNKDQDKAEKKDDKEQDKELKKQSEEDKNKPDPLKGKKGMGKLFEWAKAKAKKVMSKANTFMTKLNFEKNPLANPAPAGAPSSASE